MIMITVNLEEIAQKEKERVAEFDYHVLVCMGTGCIATGAGPVHDEFVRLIGENNNNISVEMSDSCSESCLGKGEIKDTGCHGFCQIGPLVVVKPPAEKGGEIFYCHVRAEDVQEIMEKSVKNGEVIERLLHRNPQSDVVYRSAAEIPFYARQKRTALVDCGHINPESIEEYIERGGYAATRRVITKMTPEQVCNEVLSSGMRGRGGGGFPTGRKWLAALEAEGDRKYLVCNGDEGDPGAFMDRSMMEGDPYRVLEGAIIAAYAVGASHGYFYIRAEYPLALKRIEKAIATSREMGLLGKNLFGTDFSFDCEISEGAGAFVCGEETALLASIEGKRGMPKSRPPFPVHKGLFGKPTVLNNVETLATVRYIMEKGAENFRKYGIPPINTGTKTFALTGHVRNNGLIEVPLGITMREIVFDIGGGIPDGRKFKAVQVGGPSGGCLGKDELDISIDFDSLKKVGAMMGSGGIVVMDENTCMVEIARFFMQFTQNESCGKCILCREGTKQMLGILQDITEGKAQLEDIELLEETAWAVKTASLCGLGKTAPNPVLSTLAMFRSEYLAHVERLYCPAGVCEALRSYSVDPDLCKGCTLCIQKCPVEAIQGEKRKPHRIDVSKCTKCGICADICKFAAIALN